MKDLFEKTLLETMENGTIEAVIKEQIEKSVKEITKGLFKWNGKAKTAIEDQLMSQIVPAIEKYDFSRYVVKLDEVMTNVLNEVNSAPKKILENFECFMTNEVPEQVTLQDLFNKYKKFAAENVETSNLEIEYYDCEPAYQDIDVKCYVSEVEERPSYYDGKDLTIFFECEQDETLSKVIKIKKSSYREEYYFFNRGYLDLLSLRRIDKFDIYALQLQQNFTNYEYKEYEELCEEISVEQEPEMDVSYR